MQKGLTLRDNTPSKQAVANEPYIRHLWGDSVLCFWEWGQRSAVIKLMWESRVGLQFRLSDIIILLGQIKFNPNCRVKSVKIFPVLRGHTHCTHCGYDMAHLNWCYSANLLLNFVDLVGPRNNLFTSKRQTVGVWGRERRFCQACLSARHKWHNCRNLLAFIQPQVLLSLVPVSILKPEGKQPVAHNHVESIKS